MTLILASSSPIRRQLLQSAGIAFEAAAPDVDEAAIKAEGCDPATISRELAEAKAGSIALMRPGDWVIGSDSAVSVDGELFSKPADRRAAADHLRRFSGKAMRLTSAVALARGDAVEWSQVDEAILHVRDLGDEFINAYLDAEWPEVGYCVGVFRMEGRGVQLFDRIEGDYFTILGMPLLPLLGALRDRGLIER